MKVYICVTKRASIPLAPCIAKLFACVPSHGRSGVRFLARHPEGMRHWAFGNADNKKFSVRYSITFPVNMQNQTSPQEQQQQNIWRLPTLLPGPLVCTHPSAWIYAPPLYLCTSVPPCLTELSMQVPSLTLDLCPPGPAWTSAVPQP